MTKRFLALLLFCSLILPCSAAEVKVSVKISAKKTMDPKLQRDPVNLPIEVTYDDEAQTVRVFCVNDVAAEVYVYNSADELEAYSPQLNSILSVTNSDYHTIVIDAEDWTGIGIVE